MIAFKTAVTLSSAAFLNKLNVRTLKNKFGKL